jgi:ABC-type multidrug transport system ATPase subunit
MGVCDEIIVLDFGTKIASGMPEQVRSNPAVIAAYLGDETDDDADGDAAESERTTASATRGSS